MTREEAIIQLRLGPGINEDVSEKYNEAVNMAIEALQAEAEQVTGKLRKHCDSLLTGAVGDCKEKQSKLESADAVEVVRCKECKHRRPVMHTRYGSCIFSACLVKSDGYCSHGEIETEEVQQTLL